MRSRFATSLLVFGQSLAFTVFYQSSLPSFSKMNRTLGQISLFVLIMAVSVGCPPTSAPETPPLEVENTSSSPSANQQLKTRLDATLDAGLRQRQLSIQRNGAWQILHGVLAYGQDCSMETPEGTVPVIPYLLDGGVMKGFEPLPGDRFENPDSQGLRMELDPGGKTGQGHRDQWLAILSQCDIPADQTIRVGSRDFTVLDLVRQTEWDIPRNLEMEYSWTLIGLTAYRPTTHRWTARDGNTWNIAGLVESELQRDLRSSACGGTHRIIGLAMTLQRHLEEGGQRAGVWAEVGERLNQAIAAAKMHQNADGSFSSAYFHRPGWTPDLAETLSTTGHTVEMVSIAADDATLREEWVERAVMRLCDVLELTADVDLECGALYHALHGLQVYRQRRFGT